MMSKAAMARVLIVDDDAAVRDLLCYVLSERYECHEARSAEQALAKLRGQKFALMLSDIEMEAMSGLDLLTRALSLEPTLAVIIVSSMTAIDYAIEALRGGAVDYVTKPFSLPHLEAVVERAFSLHETRLLRQAPAQAMEADFAARASKLKESIQALESSYRTTLMALTTMLEAKDVEAPGHAGRVVAYSRRLGREMGLNQAQINTLADGALLHDIGKIGVPDAILHKPGPLTEDEWHTMRRHPQIGQQMLGGIDFLAEAVRVVGQHHERWDGAGYPNGWPGRKIDLNARIFAVVDAFDAITSKRSYRAGSTYAAALHELQRNAGRQFDPQVVAAFASIAPQEWPEMALATTRQQVLAK